MPTEKRYTQTYENLAIYWKRAKQVGTVLGTGGLLAACNLVATDKQSQAVEVTLPTTQTSSVVTETPTRVSTSTLAPSATFTERPTETLAPTLTAIKTATPDNEATVAAGIEAFFATQTAIAPTKEPATATLTPTPIPTASEAPTNTAVPPTLTLVPSPTIEQFQVTATPTAVEISQFHILPDTGLTVSEVDGTVSIDIPKFRNYFAQSVDAQGKDTNGEVIDFTANMFGTPMNEFTFDKSPNWWINRKDGLGWTSADPIYENLDEVTAAGPTQVFEERDGVYRFGVRVEAKDFEKAYAVAAVYRYLVGANKAGGSPEEIVAYLADPTVDAKIQFLWKTLVSQSGYKPVAGEKQDTPLSNWPGAVKVFQNDMPNMVSDNGKDMCETDMKKASVRGDQREKTHNLDITLELEKKTTANDEKINAMDANSDVLVMVTFNNTVASASPSLSPDGKGKIRVDLITARDYPDALSGTAPVVDGINLTIEKANFGRIINCGNGNAVIATATSTAIFTPQGMVVYETPQAPIATPKPGETPQPTLTPDIPPTAVPTNDKSGAPTATSVPDVNPTDQPEVQPTFAPQVTTAPTPSSDEPTPIGFDS